MFAETVSPQLIKEYVDTGKVRFIFRNWPVYGGQDSARAAEAAYCAQDQGKFWEYHEKLYATSSEEALVFPPDVLKRLASETGLNTTAFNTCYDSHKYVDQVTRDTQYGSQVGAQMGFRGTPSYTINNAPAFLMGANATAWIANFKKQFDTELAK